MHDVSVLVWESFNEETPKGKVIMHKNKNQRDNRISNLELTTWSNSHSVNFKLGLLPHLEEIHASMVGSKWNEEHGVYINGKLTEILCVKCFVHKPISNFERTRNCCKQCRGIASGRIKEVGKLEYLKSLADAGLKRCYKCDEIKRFDGFYKGSSRCKVCYKTPKP